MDHSDPCSPPKGHKLIFELCKYPAGRAEFKRRHLNGLLVVQPGKPQIAPGGLTHVYLVIGLVQVYREHVIVRLEVQRGQLDTHVLEIHAFLPHVVVDVHQIQDQPQLAIVQSGA